MARLMTGCGRSLALISPLDNSSALFSIKRSEPLLRLGRAKALGYAIPGARFLHISAHPDDSEPGKNRRIVTRGQFQCRGGVTGFRHSLKDHPRGDHIAGRDVLLGFVDEKNDDLGL